MSLTNEERRERGWTSTSDYEDWWSHVGFGGRVIRSRVDEIESYVDLRVGEALEDAAQQFPEYSSEIRAMKPKGSDGQSQG